MANNNLSEDESEFLNEDIESYGLEPYMFEPERSDSEDNSTALSEDSGDEEEQEQWRLQNLSWCTCSNCPLMDTVIESRCCKERNRVCDKMEEVQIDTCITDHPGFDSICLNEWPLQVAYLAYRQEYGERPGALHEKYRYTAYRQFVRWCWSYLGKQIRVTIPACVVNKIREKFPSQNYTGFKLPNLD